MTRRIYILLAMASVFAALSLSGCKAQKQMQQQIADMDARMGDMQRRLTAMDAEVKRMGTDNAQIKGLLTKLGNVVVDLQKAEEDRQRAAAEAKAKASSKGGKGKKKSKR